jgi:F-type H+-transporting ATPase subunit epsilon
MSQSTVPDLPLKCVIVTPDRTAVDERAAFIALPLYDGELGVLPGRAPLVGRLGVGMVRISHNGDSSSIFVDGGFVQIRDDVVTILTQRALTLNEVTPELAGQEMAEAKARLARAEAEFETKQRAMERARMLTRYASRRS